MSETQEDIKSPERTRRVIQNGPAIRSLREKDGYTQAGFAVAIGMARSNLVRIEEEQSSTRVATLHRIARQLRVPVAAVMRERDSDCASTTPAPAGVAA